jgi:hypothetical protein
MSRRAADTPRAGPFANGAWLADRSAVLSVVDVQVGVMSG